MFQTREPKQKQVKEKILIVEQNIKKEEFQKGLEEQGFEYKENSKGDRCYTLPYSDALFIMCYRDYWTVRLFCIEDSFGLQKNEYRGVVNGLKLLRTK